MANGASASATGAGAEESAPTARPASRGNRLEGMARRAGAATALAWPRGLSARLLVLTILVALAINLLILPPSLASVEERWLIDRLRAAELASLVRETAPGGVVTGRVSRRLLDSAGVVSVALQVGAERRLILAAPRLARTPYLIDLRAGGPMSWLTPFRTLTGGGQRMVRVMARPALRQAAFIEVVAPDAPLRRELRAQIWRLLAIAVFTSLAAGAVVYAALAVVLVRPMQRITRAMERFRADPEDPRSHLKPSGRRDEIGRAEAELERMQADLRAALASRARLAALGEAVARINHDLRNMLTSAQLASERLADFADPRVAKALPRLERALGHAAALTSNVLTFGRSAEPAPEPRPTPLRAALEAAAEDAGLGNAVTLSSDIDAEAEVRADPEQLHRILVNLLRNAREAVEGSGGGQIAASLRRTPVFDILRLVDTGPGLPDKARAHLFQPFAGSTRKGGAGLGLAIARELAQGHGGDLELVETGDRGTTFDLRLPNAAPA